MQEETVVPRQLDDIDRRILKALVANGRLSNTELAREVGLSPSPCWQRVRRLEEEGVISGYTAVLDHEALGVGETVMIEVSLERHDPEALEGFGKAMAEIPEVLEVYLMAGDCDYFVKVAASGTKGVEEFLRERLFPIPGLRHSKSSFSLRCLKKVTSCVPG
ncbi:Lrp/AsnC family transcriptional regulator [Stappia sp. TSB10GB4]|uniref:Lrp/AsnC family transcriptional regulator n=1 Tax=unclassified Stappia TaxID=2629676 RepID=UPI001643F3B5